LNKNRELFKIGYGALAVSLVALFAFPISDTSLEAEAFELTNVFSLFGFENQIQTASADDPVTHNIEMSAEHLPDGRFGYQMNSHVVETEDGPIDITSRYDEGPSIPGPAIIINEGDAVNLTLTNNLGEDCVSVHTHGVHYGPESDGTLINVNKVVNSCATPGNPYTYHWNADKASKGVWPYHDHTFGTELGSELEGLYGTLIVNEGKQKWLKNGKPKNMATAQIDKDFVLWMQGTSFWGMEIDHNNDGKQTPLWLNPTLKAKLNDRVRFNVIGIGSEFHTFHMHGHKWLQDGTSNVIDVQNIGPLSRTQFVVKAGEGVGTGDWMYHCHVFSHMEAGMTGIFRVTPDDQPSEPGPSPFDGLVSFVITDEPGPWFRNLSPIPGVSESLALASPGDTVNFQMTSTNTVHTVTSLIWPVEDDAPFPGATNMPLDQSQAFKGGASVKLEDPGLYVFTCKVHPYMFAAVIVDDEGTEGLDLGDNIQIVNGIKAPTTSVLAQSLLRSFFVVTDPNLWQDYTTGTWSISFPEIPLNAGGAVVPLSLINVPETPLTLSDPSTSGIGEVWVNTQFETTSGKSKFGTSTAVDTTHWNVTKKVSLPEINMNHPHNMWTDVNQDVIYQTQWFDNRLAVFDRSTGDLIDDLIVGDAPSHVMTRPDANQYVYVALNGDNNANSVVEVQEIAADNYGKTDLLDIGRPHPHGHWMNSDTMVTPNVFTGDATAHEFDSATNDITPHTELFAVGNVFGIPIATAMHPSGDKYYSANLLDSTVTCVSIGDDPQCGTPGEEVDVKPIPLLANLVAGGLLEADFTQFAPEGPVGLLPIQTPVSPDGEFVVTATLLPSITIINATSDELILSLPCDAGCHGVNFGAKSGEGYYAYVSSKFSNALIVFDPAEAVDADKNGNNNGVLDGSELDIVGKVLLHTDNADGADIDDTIIGLDGMGGQGVLAIPNPYNEWIQATVSSDDLSAEVQGWVGDLSSSQMDPYP
jgi:FtsP/CotA-like multicopper oxidase with cupredoxin domain